VQTDSLTGYVTKYSEYNGQSQHSCAFMHPNICEVTRFEKGPAACAVPKSITFFHEVLLWDVEMSADFE